MSRTLSELRSGPASTKPTTAPERPRAAPIDPSPCQYPPVPRRPPSNRRPHAARASSSSADLGRGRSPRFGAANSSSARPAAADTACNGFRDQLVIVTPLSVRGATPTGLPRPGIPPAGRNPSPATTRTRSWGRPALRPRDASVARPRAPGRHTAPARAERRERTPLAPDDEPVAVDTDQRPVGGSRHRLSRPMLARLKPLHGNRLYAVSRNEFRGGPGLDP